MVITHPTEVMQILPEPTNVSDFRDWFTSQGGHIHPKVYFHPVASGFSIYANGSIPADETIVSCPFSLTITPEVTTRALRDLSSSGVVQLALDKWSERQLACTYLGLHDIVPESHVAFHLFKHRPYIRTLPSPDKLRTSLHFSSDELALFNGSNLYGATNDRREAWQDEWKACQHIIEIIDKEWGAQFSWDRYLTAATYLSSRAFPSTLLSPIPSLNPTPSSHPVLLPGIDALNHARAYPVTWAVNKRTSPPLQSPGTSTSDDGLLICLVLHQISANGSELFNNYGPKPNSELILGYGFSLPNNPDDTIVLKIGGFPPSHPNANKQWEVGREARGIDSVWRAILEAVTMSDNGKEEHGGDDDEDEAYDPRDQLYAAGILKGMAHGLLKRLPSGSVEASREVIRPEVAEMFQHYVEGQTEILKSIIQYTREQESNASKQIEELGLDMDEEDSQDGDELN